MHPRQAAPACRLHHCTRAQPPRITSSRAPRARSAGGRAASSLAAKQRDSSSSSSNSPITARQMAPDTRPKLIAFDLDGTLWWPEMYMLSGGAPFRRDASGAVFDSRGEQIRLMGASEDILRELIARPEWKDVHVAYVSRTENPEWAVPCLKTFELLPGKTMFGRSQHNEIFPGSKKQHFRNIHKRSGIAYEDMLFFDNERWNITECATMGITCIYTPEGMTAANWKEGLAQFAKAASRRN